MIFLAIFAVFCIAGGVLGFWGIAAAIGIPAGAILFYLVLQDIEKRA